MLSSRDGRCDAKDGVATDRLSLLPSELGSSGQAVWGAATLRCRGLVPWQEESPFSCHTSQMACAIHYGGWWQRGREDQSHGMAMDGIVSRRCRIVLSRGPS